MSAPNPQLAPRTNLRGLAHWRTDLLAGFTVALVALPLAFGIATAAGAPPISGVVSAIIAGVLATFLRGSHVAINGPGNSLIVIIALALVSFGDAASPFPHVLGAVVVAGGVQVLFGVMRLGRLGDLLPTAVIQGMLTAIGLIIIGKQAHVLLGKSAAGFSPVEAFTELPVSALSLEPIAATVGILSLVVLMAHPRIKAKLIHFVPAPLWVVVLSVPVVLGLAAVLQPGVPLSTDLFVSIPDDLLGSIVRPDFSRIGTGDFWLVVATITLVTSIENIVSVKAVDKLDSHRRRSNLNRDLVAMGLSSIAAAFLGGLPVLTVVARSSVNVNHGAVTGWSNFFHGVILLVCVVFLAPAIEMIPLPALAAILVYTGYKLAAPQVLKDALRRGPDFFLVFGTTVGATLVWGLLWGIAIGLAAEICSHMLILGLPPMEALRRARGTRVETMREDGGPYLIRIHGVANFLNIPRIRRVFENLKAEQTQLVLDFSPALLVDTTVLEYCHEFGRRFEQTVDGGRFEFVGLESHRVLADHPDTLHALERSKHGVRLTPRQKNLETLAAERGWTFDARRDWDPDHLDEFHFFRIHPIEYRDTVIKGRCEAEAHGQAVEFSLSDVTFDEGVLIPEVYHTTVLHLHLPFAIPEVVMEKEGLLDRVLELAGLHDINFKDNAAFSRKFVVRGPDEAAIRAFLTPELLTFFVDKEAYHIESAGRELAIFNAFSRRATSHEVERVLDFSERLAELLVAHPSWADKDSASAA
ncbi:MAG: SulP family inorganic anion transporter [Polyangiales bacterium]